MHVGAGRVLHSAGVRANSCIGWRVLRRSYQSGRRPGKTCLQPPSVKPPPVLRLNWKPGWTLEAIGGDFSTTRQAFSLSRLRRCFGVERSETADSVKRPAFQSKEKRVPRRWKQVMTAARERLAGGLRSLGLVSESESAATTKLLRSNADMAGLEGVKPVSFRGVGRILSRYAWPRDNPALRRRVIFAVSLLLASKVLLVQVPVLFKVAVDMLSKTADWASMNTSIWPIFMLVAYGLARGSASLTNELRNAVFATVSQKAISDLALTTFRRILDLDLSYHSSRKTGALARTIDRGMRGIDFLMRALVFNIFPTILEVGLVCGMLAYSCGGRYALIAGGALTAYTVFTLIVTQWRTQFRKSMNIAENAASNKAIDSLMNYETVKYFNNESVEAEQYETFLEKYGRENVKTQVSLSVLNFGQNAIFTVAMTAMMVMAAREVMQGLLTVGDIVMVNGLLFQMSMPLNFLGTVYREVRQSLTDMEMMFGVMQLRPRVIELPSALPLIIERDTGIAFQRVSFTYPSLNDLQSGHGATNHQILRDVSFTVPHGKKMALIGPSGCGKSTILKLLFRFYDPDEGSIFIGGQDIRRVQLSSLRQAISCIPQDIVLFNNTVEYNIRYGRIDATKDEIEAAAKAAYIHDTITQHFPEGYDTVVGERGVMLSGGEKQRIAIARAILKNSPILVCDEMSSALDSSTELLIRQAIQQVSASRTSIFIAHRLASIVDAHEILVMDEGRIMERGQHHELLRDSSTIYTQMWRAQQAETVFPSQERRMDELP
jgi:ATP-binding cassette subfamily B (MDR/TAP) protein 7